MANCVSVMTKMHLYNFDIPCRFAMVGQPNKRHNVRAQQQDADHVADPDWLNPLPLGIMSNKPSECICHNYIWAIFTKRDK